MVVKILVLLLVYRKSLCMLVCCFMASMFVTHLLLYINCFFGFRFAGGRQPKQPIPPGDSAFFYHGMCVATSSLSGDLEPPRPSRGRKLKIRERELQSKEIGLFINSLTVTSHSCKLNICLGGGGFNCISFYSGTSFVFDVGQQIGGDDRRCDDDLKAIAEPSLPPPFPSTIIGGTGRYVQFKM